MIRKLVRLVIDQRPGIFVLISSADVSVLLLVFGSRRARSVNHRVIIYVGHVPGLGCTFHVLEILESVIVHLGGRRRWSASGGTLLRSLSWRIPARLGIDSLSSVDASEPLPFSFRPLGRA
jgi:hypothetical protein